MKLVEFIVTFFYFGKIKLMPGTAGSLAALVPGILIKHFYGGHALLVAALALMVVGIICTYIYLDKVGGDDPSEVVIDEVVGQWLALLAFPMTYTGILIAFAVFRIFDILKIWPVSYFDEEMSGALGVMMDDVMAGIYPLIIINLLAFLLSYILPPLGMWFDVHAFINSL